MRITAIIILNILITYSSMGQTNEHIKKTSSKYSVSETAKKIVGVVESKGLKVFTEISHSEGAEKAGLELEDTHLIIFGNPKVGTKLMQCDRNMGLMLPLKALVWSEGGLTYISHIDPTFFKDNFDLSECAEVVEKVKGALNGIIKAAVE